MGKIRRYRKKFHLPKTSDGSSSAFLPERNKSRESEANFRAETLALLPKSYDNIFEGVDISKILVAQLDSEDCAKTSSETNNIATSLALLPQSYNVFEGVYSKDSTYKIDSIDDDARTTISVSKSVFKNRGTSKEERRKLRHQTFIERINAIQAMKMNQNKKEKKMFVAKEPSTSAARTTIPLPQESDKTVATRQGRIVKSRARHKRMLKDIAVLTKLWENPKYKADPTGFVSETVHEHLEKEVE